MRKKILIIGANSLVAKEFISRYSGLYSLTLVTKANVHELNSGSGSYDTLIYLAQSGDYKSNVFTDDLFEVNVNLLFRTVLTQKKNTANIIYFSTGSVYDFSAASEVTVKTNLAYTSKSPYVTTKLMAEQMLNAFSPEYNSINILRPFFIYGKDQKDNMIIKSVYNKIINGETVSLSGDKGLEFNPVHCSDVALLLHAILENTQTGLHTFNVCGPSITNLKEVALIIGKLAGQHVNIEIAGTQNTSIIAKAESIYGWLPQKDIADGLKKSFYNEE